MITPADRSPSLSSANPDAFLPVGDLLLHFRLNPITRAVEFLPIPAGKEDRLVPRRTNRPSHPVFEGEDSVNFLPENQTDSLVQTAIRHLPAAGKWRTGESMRNSAATESLAFREQTVEERDGRTLVTTVLDSPHGFEMRHRVEHPAGAPGILVRTEIRNTGKAPLPVEMLSSFSLSGITPFAADDAPGRLKVHRFRSAWSNEAGYSVRSVEDLHLERTWTDGPVSQRFGQSGSLPVRGFHPFAAIEDRGEGVFWGAQLVWHGSWEMELYRRDDGLCLSGGLGDYERAHWMKSIEPGECFETPTALLTACTGDFDDLCRRLVKMQDGLAHPEPECEKDMPIIFNEWCSSWGNPTHDDIVKTAERLRGTETRYLVIDDGWAERPEGSGFQFNGDWNLNRKAFPGGIDKTAAAIREAGLVPGVWFEFEICTEGTEAFKQTDHQLKRHGQVLQVGTRRFWDFRDPWTFDYLSEKVIRFLRDNGFGYLKVDYNESIGIGCDGAESLGEGLRRHLVAVQAFFAKIRREIPGIMIENCASGGHRQEPGMIALTTMSSFSDAHETVEIPIIAAQLNRLVPARKLQIWAVLRPGDSSRRLHYSLAATFLGRMCVSGDVIELPSAAFERMREAQTFYQEAKAVIRDGEVRLIDDLGPSRRYPQGWQCVVRSTENGLLLVLHCFELRETGATVRFDLPEGLGSEWNEAARFGEDCGLAVEGRQVSFRPDTAFTAQALLLRRADAAPSNTP